MKESGIAGTQSVERALGLLKVMQSHRDELRVSELVELSGLGQSTVSRLLASLENAGFVEQDPRSGLYRVGTEVIGLAAIALNQRALHREGRQVAQNLASALGLGANVAEFTDERLRYLCHFEGERAPRSFTMIGRQIPLHATAMGKAVLATFNDEHLRTYLADADLTRFTPNTPGDERQLLRALEACREQGYATEVEELAFGRACIAAAVRDHRGIAVGALSVSGPLSALDLGQGERDLALKVIEAADNISIALGYIAHAKPAALPGRP